MMHEGMLIIFGGYVHGCVEQNTYWSTTLFGVTYIILSPGFL
jgi:hypothetical protein